MTTPTIGDVTACIAPYADTSRETAKAARSAAKTSRGIEYILTLKAATAKKLSEIPAAAKEGEGAQGTRAVTRQATAASRHTRVRAAIVATPAFIHRNESAPPVSPPSAPHSGGSQANQAAPTKLSRLTSTRCSVVQ